MEALLARCTPAEFAELARLIAAKQQSVATELPTLAQPLHESPAVEPVVDSQPFDTEMEEGEVGSPSEPATPPPAYLSFGRMSPTTRARQRQELLSGQYLMLGDGYDANSIRKDAGILQLDAHRHAFASMMDLYRPRKVVQPLSKPQPAASISAPQPSNDRAQYLAKLQAAKNKKTEIPKAPLPAPVATEVPKKKNVDPKKNELLRQKLAALKAGQASPRSGLGAGLANVSTVAADPAAFLDSIVASGLSQANELTTSSGRSSALSAAMSLQPEPASHKRPAPAKESHVKHTKPLDRSAHDFYNQQVVIQVSDEDQSDLDSSLDDDSDDGVDVELPVRVASVVSSAASLTPRVPTPTAMAYAKKLQEIELTKRMIAEKEDRAKSRTSGPATPVGSQSAFAIPPVGGIPGIANTDAVDDAVLNSADTDVNMSNADVEDDEDFDDIYNTAETGPAAATTVMDPLNATTRDNSTVPLVLDNVDTEMEDTEDFYDDADGQEGIELKNQASTALVAAVVNDQSGMFLEAGSTTPLDAQNHEPASTLAAIATQDLSTTDEDEDEDEDENDDDEDEDEDNSEDDSDASMDMSDSEDDSEDDTTPAPLAVDTASVPSNIGTAVHNVNSSIYTPEEQQALGSPTEESDPNTAKTKWVTKHTYKQYESPLTYLKGYGTPAEQGAPADSLTYHHKIDPMKPLCPTEGSGEPCTCPGCGYQHFKDMALDNA